MEQEIKSILETAVMAPSGHNYQPWKFRVEENIIYIFNVPEKDSTIYNFRQRGSFIAHGALLENILIASAQHGYTGHIRLFPDQNSPDLIASVQLKRSSSVKKDPLYPYIPLRTTNRKAYAATPLQDSHQDKMRSIADEIGGGKIQFIEELQQRKMLAGSLSLNERLALENHHVHQSLFPHLLWTPKEDAQQRVGLYIKTLELPPPVQLAFKLLTSRFWARQSSKIGLPKLVAATTKKLYASSGAIGLLSIPSNSDADFVVGGRILQRMWLTATQLGLSLQPVAGTVYLGQRVLAGDTEKFSAKQVELIQQSYETIKDIFGVTKETMLMIFRIGYSKPPSARAQKLPPQYIGDDMKLS